MINSNVMRMLVLFDLPTEDFESKKEYSKFRKSLLSNGFIMVQYSIYVKTLSTKTKTINEISKISKFLPSDGNIRILMVTDHQYQNMILLKGSKNINEIYNGNERIVKI